MVKKKKNKNPFFVLHKPINGGESGKVEPIKPKPIRSENSVGSVPKVFIFDQIKTILSDYIVELFERKDSHGHATPCPKCNKMLHRLENMVVLSDKQTGYYGLNVYYCSACNTLFIDKKELSVVQSQVSSNAIKIIMLLNYGHNLGKKKIEILPRKEAELRGLLDKMNELSVEYKIYKEKNLPTQCPVCDRMYLDAKDAITLFQNANDKKFSIRGRYCKNCKMLCIEERVLEECVSKSITSSNLKQVIVNDISKKDEEEIASLEKYFADGKILYIHKGNIICEKNHHDVISVTAVVPAVSNNKSIEININYCRDCEKCYISETVYDLYRDKGELPAVHFAPVKLNGTFPSEFEPPVLAAESPLHLLGYNVGQTDDFSDAYRQKLLARIMDCGALNKHQIEKYLTLFIKKNGSKKNMSLALNKWKTDLEFVERYHLNEQERVKIISIQPN